MSLLTTSQVYQLFSFLIHASKKPTRVINVVKGLVEDMTADVLSEKTLTEMSVILSAVNGLIDDDSRPEKWSYHEYVSMMQELIMRAKCRGRHLDLSIDTFPITEKKIPEFTIAAVLAVVYSILLNESARTGIAVFKNTSEWFIRQELEHIWSFFSKEEQEAFNRLNMKDGVLILTSDALESFRRAEKFSPSNSSLKALDEKLNQLYQTKPSMINLMV